MLILHHYKWGVYGEAAKRIEESKYLILYLRFQCGSAFGDYNHGDISVPLLLQNNLCGLSGIQCGTSADADKPP